MNSSIKYQKSIDKLLDEVYLHYIQSTEFNGLPLSSVTSCSKDETKDVLQKLIEKGDIYVLSSKFDSNPYIIRFGFPSIEEQIEYIQNYSFNEELVCIHLHLTWKRTEMYQNSHYIHLKR